MENEKITLDASQNINLNEIPVNDNDEKKNVVNDSKNVLNDDENKNVDKTYNELRKIAKEKGLSFTKNVSKADLINLINEADSVNANAMSQDNKPISPVVLTNDKEEIPIGFIAVKPKPNKDTLYFYNGRGYKFIGNGYGMWCDNGQSFLLNDLK